MQPPSEDSLKWHLELIRDFSGLFDFAEDHALLDKDWLQDFS